MTNEVHEHHCCKKWCKYSDEDCPVVSGETIGLYQCEDCDCLEFNPFAAVEAEDWWNNLSPAMKASIYLRKN